jgi:CDP-diglyceride synthetase
MDRQNLKKRIITAAVLIAFVTGLLILASIFCVGKKIMAIVALVAVAMCALEYCLWPRRTGEDFAQGGIFESAFTFCLLLSAPLAVSLLIFGTDVCKADFAPELSLSVAFLAFFVSITLVVLWVSVGSSLTLDQRAVIIRDLFVALVLIGLGGAVFLCLILLPASPFLIAWLLIVVYANDVAAFFGGKKIGGPAVAAIISPSKTVAGSLCGLVSGVLVGIFLWVMIPGMILPTSFAGVLQAGLVSLLVVVAAQAGDLCKSFLKRTHGVKDSSNILPGHGGLLDRMDALFFSSPIFLGLLLILRHLGFSFN